MIEKLNQWIEITKDKQADIQTKLDNMNVTDSNEELFSTREERVELLENIVTQMEELAESIDDYNSRYNGLKGIK